MSVDYYNKFAHISYPETVRPFKTVIVTGAGGEMGGNIATVERRTGVDSDGKGQVFYEDISLELIRKAQAQQLKLNEQAGAKRKLPQSVRAMIALQGAGTNLIVPPKFPDTITDEQTAADFFLSLADNDANRELLANVDLVIEAGPETQEYKKEACTKHGLFVQRDRNKNNAILATNTSSLLLSDFVDGAPDQSDTAYLHFFKPADRHPSLEVGKGPNTSDLTVLELVNHGISAGKQPIICFEESRGLIANSIYVSILNQLAQMYDKGVAPLKTLDKVMLETFYGEQAQAKTKEARNQFRSVINLSFFADEERTYSKIAELDRQIKTSISGKKSGLEKLLAQKKTLIEAAKGNLAQKVLYTHIGQNFTDQGSYYKPANCIVKAGKLAHQQFVYLSQYLKEVKENPDKLKEKFEITPYKFPPPSSPLGVDQRNKSMESLICDRLMAAYITRAHRLYTEGKATKHDIALVCQGAFKFIHGPHELAELLGKEKTDSLIRLAYWDLPRNQKTGMLLNENTGIVDIDSHIESTPEELNGVQVHVQGDVGFITLGKYHLQNMQLTQNSLSPEMLTGILNAFKKLENDPRVKVAVIRSQGGGPFSSGADLNYLDKRINFDYIKSKEYFELGNNVFNYIEKSNLPSVAVIDKAAVGGGAELAMACDYRVMSDSSYIAFPEVGIGLVPGWGGLKRLPALIGKELSLRLVCSATLSNLGPKLGGKEAVDVGFADIYTPQSELPQTLAKLITDEIPEINIYRKASEKQNHGKTNYPIDIATRFKLDQPFKHSWLRWLTIRPAHIAEQGILASDNPEKFNGIINKDSNLRQLLESARGVTHRYIHRMLSWVKGDWYSTLFSK